ncbi:hypothetical protein AURDEDRAFT_163588 [Auricularia subglabra TFB-10046 SS5]|nr:hypothetical protein AURDEDRAFT_163588 [Auricularia subglabra TFB-10046 SS5]
MAYNTEPNALRDAYDAFLAKIQRERTEGPALEEQSDDEGYDWMPDDDDGPDCMERMQDYLEYVRMVYWHTIPQALLQLHMDEYLRIRDDLPPWKSSRPGYDAPQRLARSRCEARTRRRSKNVILAVEPSCPGLDDWARIFRTEYHVKDKIAAALVHAALSDLMDSPWAL